MSNATWNNNDGLQVRFGTAQGNRESNGQRRPGVTNSTSHLQELVYWVDLEGAARTTYTADLNNDATKDGFTNLDAFIPSGVIVTEVEWITEEASAGGTNWELGTYQIDGTIVDIDAVINDNSGPEVGALVANGTPTSQKLWLATRTTGTYSAGKFKVFIRYIVA